MPKSPPPPPSPHIAETVFFSICGPRPDKSPLRITDIRGLFFPAGRRYAENTEAPDIVFIRGWGEPAASVRIFNLWRNILRTRRRYGFRPALFSRTHEPDDLNLPVNFHFSSAPSKRRRDCPTNIAFMLVFRHPLHRSLLPETAQRDEYREQLLKTTKTRFCSFIYSDDYRPHTQVRRDFCRLLSQYKRADCPGASLNNMPRIDPIHGGWKSRLNFMAGCRFSIAFEHTSLEYYLTEKLGDALYAGAVPIYWGDPRAAEYFNPEAFINCHDYDSFENAIKRVIEVDNDPQLYEKYRSAPPVLPDSGFYRMKRKVESHCAAIVEEGLRRRSIKRKPLWDALRLYAMMLRCLPVEIKGRATLAYARLRKKLPWIKNIREMFRQPHLRRIRRATFR